MSRSGTELSYSLEVTPTRLPDGSPSVPFVLGPFVLDSRTRTFDLPMPITVAGRVRRSGEPVAATLHFTQLSTPAGRNTKPIVVTTTDDTDVTVQLLRDVEYHVTIEPTDTSDPPYAFDFVAALGEEFDVDYAKVHWAVEKFHVEGLPTDYVLTMRALELETGVVISSTATISESAVNLTFPPEHGAYRLEIAAAESYAKTPSNEGAGAAGAGAPTVDGDACDESAPQFPVLSIAESALRQDETGTNVFAIPEIPATVSYSGVVRLCEGTSATSLQGMPMAMDAQALSLGNSDGAVQARYNANTNASYDAVEGELRFCANVLPGDYVVVITPPANVQCELFAERRLIAADTTDVLALRKSAVLSGTIETPTHMPIGAAAIDARALGEDLALGDDDRSVPSYNRSTQAVVEADGTFRLPVDVGSYDIVFKPAIESGFAWEVHHDVDIGSRLSFVTRVTLDAPVLATGKLRYGAASRGDQRSLAGAEVRAYTQVPNSTRNIEVARSTANEDGEVVLIFAPALRKGF